MLSAFRFWYRIGSVAKALRVPEGSVLGLPEYALVSQSTLPRAGEYIVDSMLAESA